MAADVCECAADVDCFESENSVNAVTGTNRSRRTHDSLQRCRIAHEHASLPPPFEISGGAPTVAALPKHGYRAPRRAVYGSVPGDGGGDDTRSSSGHLISCHFQFRRLEIPSLFPPRTLTSASAPTVRLW